jgi:hypothetical protein
MIDGKTTQTSRIQARENIEDIAMQYLEAWRAESDKGDSEAIMREYIVISDNEDSTESEDEDESDEGEMTLRQEPTQKSSGIARSTDDTRTNLPPLGVRQKGVRKKYKHTKKRRPKALRYEESHTDLLDLLILLLDTTIDRTTLNLEVNL